MSVTKSNQSKIAEVMARTEGILGAAKLGLKDLLDPNKERRISGLQNLIVFGRSVTLVLQNLSSAAEGFEEWYTLERERMKADRAMRFFVDARNEILKQGKLKLSTSVSINIQSHDHLMKLVPPPPGARGFFIADQLGGSGWEVALPNGELISYYVSLPTEIGECIQLFSDLSAEKFPELAGRSVDELATYYIEQLSDLVDRAKSRFLSEADPAPASEGKKERHLRLVKG